MVSCRRGSSVGPLTSADARLKRIALPQAIDDVAAVVGNARPVGAQNSDVPAERPRPNVVSVVFLLLNSMRDGGGSVG